MRKTPATGGAQLRSVPVPAIAPLQAQNPDRTTGRQRVRSVVPARPRWTHRYCPAQVVRIARTQSHGVRSKTFAGPGVPVEYLAGLIEIVTAGARRTGPGIQRPELRPV